MRTNLPRIAVLPEIVQKRIAAGEVVEGPFSVVKELMENSLDAGSDRIEVEVEENGMKRICVRDNGCGIHPQDIHLTVEEHATSKISDIQDIKDIMTFGFRGEALSSISSIADVTLLSRQHSEQTGKRLTAKGGTINITDYAGPEGTVVIVENLFYSVPARKKFLKSGKSEMRAIKEIFIKIAIAHPGKTFILISDSKKICNYMPVNDSLHRLRDIYGNQLSDHLLEEELQDIKVRLYGLLSGPEYLRGNRSLQMFYINRRPVEYQRLGFLLGRAYEAIAPSGKYPASFIFMEIDPSLIDVNIHPSKRQVKLFDTRYTDSLVSGLAQKALNRIHTVTKSLLIQTPAGKEETETSAHKNNYAHFQDDIRSHALFEPTTLYNNRNFISYTDNTPEIKTKSMEGASVLGIIFNTYILAVHSDEFLIIDFHAAHERKLYDRLKSGTIEVDPQELLVPVQINPGFEDFSRIMEMIDFFEKMGIIIEEFSENSLIVRAMPSYLNPNDAESILMETIDSHHERGIKKIQPLEKLIQSLACHGAKRKGDRLNHNEMMELLRWILEEAEDYRCPHGRPFVYRMKNTDLERLFKR